MFSRLAYLDPSVMTYGLNSLGIVIGVSVLVAGVVVAIVFGVRAANRNNQNNNQQNTDNNNNNPQQ